ncbi:hypothetical protein RsTz2092_06580 [Deferribacterales bacterium RsTz2092]|nr:hypothetical protein AGMMS49941_03330 [Deferribacterales bacterium]
MRISESYNNDVVKGFGRNVSESNRAANATYMGEPAATNASKVDSLDFSSSRKIADIAVQLRESALEGRKERISELREQIKSGTYHVSSREIAERIVSDNGKLADFDFRIS